MVETSSSSRLPNMEAFAKAALSLFREALARGWRQRAYPALNRFFSIVVPACAAPARE
jgi:hypothetical protein